jgi:hypothetical protein
MSVPQPVHGGAGDDYYNEGQGPTQNYPMQYQQQPPQQAAPQQGYNDVKYNQNPPTYGYANAQASPPQGEKQDFTQAFKLEGPKWHDVWASVLVRLPLQDT